MPERSVLSPVFRVETTVQEGCVCLASYMQAGVDGAQILFHSLLPSRAQIMCVSVTRSREREAQKGCHGGLTVQQVFSNHICAYTVSTQEARSLALFLVSVK